MKKKVMFYSSSILFLNLLAVSVSAQNMLSKALAPLATLDFWTAYLNTSSIMDFVLSFVLMENLFKDILKKREFPPQIIRVLAIIFSLGVVIALDKLRTNLVYFMWPIMLLGVGFYLIKNFTSENKMLITGIGFLVMAKIMELVKAMVPAAGTFPFWDLIYIAFYAGGFIFVMIGIFQLLGSGFTSIANGAKALGNGIKNAVSKLGGKGGGSGGHAHPPPALAAPVVSTAPDPSTFGMLPTDNRLPDITNINAAIDALVMTIQGLHGVAQNDVLESHNAIHNGAARTGAFAAQYTNAFNVTIANQMNAVRLAMNRYTTTAGVRSAASRAAFSASYTTQVNNIRNLSTFNAAYSKALSDIASH